VLRVPPRHAVTAPRRPRHRAKTKGNLRYSIEAILSDLPRAHRQILIATYFRRQAAKQLGITHDDVRRRVYHATRELTSAVAAARTTRDDELPPTNPDRWRRRAGAVAKGLAEAG
jgi:DNA-directed RNA polymerase specialized sigma24 family protein